jgi:hypothetical protein
MYRFHHHRGFCELPFVIAVLRPLGQTQKESTNGGENKNGRHHQ